MAEPAKSATSSQYYYWDRRANGELQGDVVPPQNFAPRPLDEPAQQNANPTGGSAWNAAGTWEEKDCSSWAKTRLTELLVGVACPSHGLSITGVKECDGEATIVFVRGKKKVGYDLDLKLEWAGEVDGKRVEGKIAVSDLSDSSGGQASLRVTSSKNDDAHRTAKNHMEQQGVPLLKSRLEQFVSELSNK